MGRQQPTPQSTGTLLRTALAVLVLLAAPTRSGWALGAGAVPPTADASPAPPERELKTHSLLESAVRFRAARVSGETCASADVMLEANAKRIDATAAKNRSRVARRLGKEFGVPARALNLERTRLGASWGELVIARTFAAGTKPRLSVEQLIGLHRDGLGWGPLAAGLGLDLADAVNAVSAEARVATGALPADGKLAPIRAIGPPVTPGPDGILSALLDARARLAAA